MKKQFLFRAALLIGLFILQTGLARAEIDPNTAQKLLAEDGTAFDYFGYSVSVSGDTALIGARAENNKGAAYIFVRSSSGVWIRQAKLTDSDGQIGDGFGETVSVFGDIALVGAPYNNFNGSVLIFSRSSSGIWSQQARLTADDGLNGNDGFGFSVSVDGDTAVIGAVWVDDGSGARAGAAYVFTRSGTAWTQQAKLTADDGGADWDYFGGAVSLDGDTALISAKSKNNGAGAAYVFVRSGTAWTQQAKLMADDSAENDQFGWSVSLSGDTALIGAPNTSGAYIFVRSGTAWTQQIKLVAEGDGAFGGISVSLSGDAALIGAPMNSYSGSVFVFVRSSTGDWTQKAKLNADNGGEYMFGWSVACSGNTVLIGAWGDANNGERSGAVYGYGETTSDADNDGIADGNDQCPATASGDVVNSAGCSIIQLCPCDSNWKNRGRYIQCIQQASRKFMAAKLITKKEGMKIMKSAVKSQCGWKK